jgi:viroplasmin and RNaseH domain-containing protein
MGVSFTDEVDPLFVETVVDEEEEASDFENEAASLAESEVSMSEFEGPDSALPRWCLFGPKECRCIFDMSSDKGVFSRVCGKAVATCTTRHSSIGEQAEVGYYEPIKARKYFDGKLHTFLSMEDYAVEEQQRKETKALELQQASIFLKDLGGSPTGSEEAEYARFHKAPNVSTSFTEREITSAEDRTTDLSVARRLKEAPHYDYDGSVKPVATPRPSKTPEPDSREPLLNSPTLKNLHGQGVASEAMPALSVAMMGMMDELAKSMTALANKVDQMEAHADLPEPRKKKAPAPKRVPEPPAPSYEGSTRAHACDWYAVGFGRDNYSGVFPSWAEAAPWVVGVSGAIHAKCHSWEEAQAFVAATQLQLQKKRDETPDGIADSNMWYAVVNSKTHRTGIYPTWGEASAHVTGVSGANAKKFRSYQEAKLYTSGHDEARAEIRREQESKRPSTPVDLTGRTCRVQEAAFVEPEGRQTGETEGYYPPRELIGVDPSTKKEDEVFGVDIATGEADLRDALCPPGLSDALAKGLVNATIDVVSMPGGFFGGGDGETSSNEMGVLGEAMAELVNQKRGMAESSGRVDLHWRSEKRTSIRSLKDVSELRKRIKILLKLRNKVLKRMHSVTTNSCKRAGWMDAIRIEAWSTNGYLPRIVLSTMEYYISLHQHLMEMATAQNDSWLFVKVELDHHVEELELIRSIADSRIQAICSLYAYLRDGHQSGWYSSSLQAKRNMELFGKVGSSQSSVSTAMTDGDAGPSCCIKCGTCLHLGGSPNCPWANLPDAQARKSGTKALRGLSQGNLKKGKGAKSKDDDSED